RGARRGARVGSGRGRGPKPRGLRNAGGTRARDRQRARGVRDGARVRRGRPLPHGTRRSKGALAYVILEDLPMKDWVKYASNYFDGGAKVWWRWLYRNQHNPTRWEDFKKELVARFKTPIYCHHDEAPSHKGKRGNLSNCQREFMGHNQVQEDVEQRPQTSNIHDRPRFNECLRVAHRPTTNNDRPQLRVRPPPYGHDRARRECEQAEIKQEKSRVGDKAQGESKNEMEVELVKHDKYEVEITVESVESEKPNSFNKEVMSKAVEGRPRSLGEGQGNTNATVARLEQRLDEVLRASQQKRDHDVPTRRENRRHAEHEECTPSPRRDARNTPERAE
ncbi:Unknown protein, partial [Striga hermonthica]